MLYFFLDAIFGCPPDFEVLFKMAREMSAERHLSDDYNEALQYIADMAHKAIAQDKVSVSGFYDHLASQVRVKGRYPSLPMGQAEAHEAIYRSTYGAR